MEANGNGLNMYITQDLPQILANLPSRDLLETMNNVIKKSCGSFLNSENIGAKTKQPLQTIQNTISTATIHNDQNLELVPQNDNHVPTDHLAIQEPQKQCMSCMENIENDLYILCSSCEEKFHLHCQKLTTTEYDLMSVNELDQYKCALCAQSCQDISIDESNKTEDTNFVAYQALFWINLHQIRS